jgi:uncharacterized membrane protein YoaK (UPF0700 family)
VWVIDRTGLREGAVALLLALVTGYVDGVGFVHMFTVFVANQSGNVILFGIGIGDADWQQVWRPALSMGAFVGGVSLGLLVASRLPERIRPAFLLAVETVALVGVAALAGDLAQRTTPFTGARSVVLLGLAAFSMGIQTDVIRRIARISVATTYSSGTLVRIGDELAGMVAHARLSPAARQALMVLGGLVAAYVAGAAVGTALVEDWGYGLWVSAAVVALMALWLWRMPLRSVPEPDGDGDGDAA